MFRNIPAPLDQGMNRSQLNSHDFTEKELFEIMPDYFYKYATINDHLKSSIEKGQLWYNTPNNFNDPFDIRVHLNYGSTKEECQANYEKWHRAFGIALPEIKKKIWKAFLKKPDQFSSINSQSVAGYIATSIGVACFSENPNHTVMWSHYGDGHKGLVLEFKKDWNGSLCRRMLPVNYFVNFPMINLSDYPEEQMISLVYQVICAKGCDWAYENEWRAITAHGNGPKKFDKSELSGVIFGLNTANNDKKEIFELVNDSGYANIKFKEATLHPRKFILEYHDYKPK